MVRKSLRPKKLKVKLTKSDEAILLPDALFKTLTREESEDKNLRTNDSEIQFIGRTDMVIEIPLGAVIEQTLFEFFASVNVIEFKSQNDPFTVEEFIENLIRTGIIFLQHLRKLKRQAQKQREITKFAENQEVEEIKTKIDTLKEYDRFLNIYVVARYPKDFLEEAAKNGIIFEKDPKREWLWWSRVGYQKIALVVCRDLPIEKRFYKWLLFAPSDSNSWREFIHRLKDENEHELLRLAKVLRPEDYNMAMRTADEIWEEVRRMGALTPEVEADLARQWQRAVEIVLADLEHKGYDQIESVVPHMNKEQLARLVEGLPRSRIAVLPLFLKQEDLKRLEEATQDPKKRQLLEILLEEQVSTTN
jgi:hypothetical protein